MLPQFRRIVPERRRRNKGGSSSSSLKPNKNNRSRTTVNTEVDETNVDNSNVEGNNTRTNLDTDSHDEDSKTGPVDTYRSSGSFDLCDWDCCCHNQHHDMKREDSGSNQGSVGSEVSFVRVKVSKALIPRNFPLLMIIFVDSRFLHICVCVCVSVFSDGLLCRPHLE